MQPNPASEHKLGRSFTKERMVGCDARNSALPVLIMTPKWCFIMFKKFLAIVAALMMCSYLLLNIDSNFNKNLAKVNYTKIYKTQIISLLESNDVKRKY